MIARIARYFNLRPYLAETLIHGFFAGSFFLLILVNGGFEKLQGLLAFFIVGTAFFTHAIGIIPSLFEKAYSTYVKRVIILSALFLMVCGLIGLPFRQTLPVNFTLLTLSGFYGSIRWAITHRLSAYAITANVKTAELNLLKSQINPHFIFNSLNVLYALALEENSMRTADSVAKMSNLIRYTLEDNGNKFISIHKEVKYLQDYIKLQLMRSSVEHDIDLHIDVNQDKMIAPMLLIPFLENAFKHGINPNSPSTLFLNLTANDKGIYFQLINSIDRDYMPSDFEKGFGIGISNVEKRLQLLYPRAYTLEVERENEVFSVELKINS